MDINIVDYKEVREIGFFKKRISKEESQEIERAILNNDKPRIKITITELNIVSKDLIKTILIYEKYNKKTVTIFCGRITLYRYLIKFGVRSKVIQERENEVDIKYIALGGSSGSLENIIYFFENFKFENITLFIIQHMNQEGENLLPNILKNYTTLNIPKVKNQMEIKPGEVYISPPGVQMEVMHGMIKLSSSERVNYSRPSIELLFNSCSDEYRSQFLAILLSGYGSDGVKSFAKFRENNSTSIILDPEECSAKPLPLEAIKENKYDYIFKMDQIIQYLEDNIIDTEHLYESLGLFLKAIDSKYGYDFTNYNIDSVKRAILNSMSDTMYTDFKKYSQKILSDESAFDELFSNLSINVSNFFRNPKVFKTLIEKIFTKLNSFPNIRIWCAGSATGEEPYSLAILLDELGLLERVQIYATDFNEEIIEESKEGIYPIDKLSRAIVNYEVAGGKYDFLDYVNLNRSFFEIKERLKDKILFFQHSLIKSGVLNEFHIIFCRNVLIYFDEALTKKTISLFHESLYSKGCLVLGNRENIDSDEFISYPDTNKGLNIYQKKD